MKFKIFKMGTFFALIFGSSQGRIPRTREFFLVDELGQILTIFGHTSFPEM